MTKASSEPEVVDPEVFEELVESGEFVEVVEDELPAPDHYANLPATTHIGPYAEEIEDPEALAAANAEAYKEAAEVAAKENAEA